MKHIVCETDNQGFIKNTYVANVNNDGVILDEDLKHCISTTPPHGLFKAKWSGSTWVEGETDQEKTERESQQLVESLKPSASEISDAELEIKIISMLTEMGVIQ